MFLVLVLVLGLAAFGVQVVARVDCIRCRALRLRHGGQDATTRWLIIWGVAVAPLVMTSSLAGLARAFVALAMS